MKLLRPSREGCLIMLVLSSIVVVLADLFMYHGFELSLETAPFIVLIMLCIVRLMRRERGKVT